MAKGTGTYDDPIICDGLFSKTIDGVKKFFKLKTGSSVDTSQFVKKSGDTLTGSQFIRNVDDSSLQFYGGTTWEHSSSIWLTGNKGKDPNTITLNCHNPVSEINEDYTTLYLRYNKTPTWNNNPIEIVNSKGSNYIRYESGLTFMWGSFLLPAETKRQTVNLPFPFTSTYQVFLSNAGNDKDYGTNIGYQVVKKSLSAFDIQHSWEGSTGWSYLAIGY